MQRREFVALVGGAVAAWPLIARAEAPEKMRRIGVLMTVGEDDAEGQARIAALREGLNQLGWVEGKNLAVEYRWAGGDMARLRDQATELVRLAPDLIVANSTPSLATLHAATTSIPVVFVLVVDPVGLGYIASLSRPGGNITGFTYMEVSLIGKWLDLLKGIAPSVNRAAFLFNPNTAPYYTTFLHSFEAEAHPGGMAIAAAPVSTADQLEATIAALAREPGGSLIVGADASNIIHREAILRLVAQYKLPTLSVYRQFAEDGALLSYGPDSEEIFRRSASYIDRILKGEAPANLPAQAPTKFEFVINLKTAKALGLSVPANLLALSDAVIE
ncbi:MAG TPA: ABC transporter substrate-binding protein [Bradyrhizobium sp.]|jgi:putative ABC transport system substrate-binding protein|uniref:ABC transporter substrate-binding protein n=1 Tax=Bradyrhizobium sp. TaxID=376 RepID=UPI002BC19723|nr:ABC transporter substrate-binding protein [Bradyrhizobium sp.]HTB03999.1 ABC transporter substrate-binding protein [Bradyrhizobium sp.]